jgi:hypothetical protein
MAEHKQDPTDPAGPNLVRPLTAGGYHDAQEKETDEHEPR